MRTPSLAGWLSKAMTERLTEMQTSGPAIVTAYDPVTQHCSAQPAVHDAYEDERGDRVAEAVPVISGIPVAFPRGGGFGMTFPLVPGDEVLLVFSRRCIDRWKTKGGVVDPGDDRLFHISDAMAIPGGASLARALANPGADHMVIGQDAGCRAHFYPTEVSVGGVTADAFFLARADRTEARLTRLETQARYFSDGNAGMTSTALLPSLEYSMDYPETPTTIYNPTHSDWVLNPALKHVHAPSYAINGLCGPKLEPTVNVSPSGAGDGVACTTLKAV